MRQRHRRILLGCLFTALMMATMMAAAVFAFVKDVDSKIEERRMEAGPAIAEALTAPPDQRDEPYYILLLGADAIDVDADDLGVRTDTIMIARLDPEAKQVSLLSIPRDTRVPIEGHGTTRINHAASYGGPSLMIDTVSEFTGLPISHYIELDYMGFKEIVDAVGGVWVDVPRRIYDPMAARVNSGDGSVRVGAMVVEAGYQKLDGYHALTFVRSRAYADGDFTRVQNQQIFIRALLDQMLSLGNLFRVTEITNAAIGATITDMNVGDVLGIVNDFWGMDLADLESATMPGNPKYIGGGSYVVVDEEAFTELLDRFSSGEPLIPVEEVEPPDPSDITVTVRNGAGLDGVAAEASEYLAGRGFGMVGIGDMNQYVYDKTLVVYEIDATSATVVREQLGMGDVVPAKGIYDFSSDVLVIVGKDWRTPVAPGVVPPGR